MYAQIASPGKPTPDVAEGRSIHQMFEDDQSEVPAGKPGGVSPITFQEFNSRGKIRRARVLVQIALEGLSCHCGFSSEVAIAEVNRRAARLVGLGEDLTARKVLELQLRETLNRLVICVCLSKPDRSSWWT